MTVAVGDETLHPVQQPGLFLLVPVRFEHHSLQVAAGIGFGEVHRAGFSGANAGKVSGFDLFRSEFVEGFGAVLQAPDVFESGVGTRDHFIGHREKRQREIQSAVLARNGHAEQSGLVQRFDILCRARGVHHMVVYNPGTIVVDAFGIRSQYVAADFAADFHHATVAVHGILEVHGGVIVFAFVGVTSLPEFHDFFHQRMIQVELEVFII